MFSSRLILAVGGTAVFAGPVFEFGQALLLHVALVLQAIQF